MAQPPVHRSILVVDVESFGARWRTNESQVAVREGLYRVLEQAFTESAIPWATCDREDRGDGVFVLAPPAVPKVLFVEEFPHSLARALHTHNETHRAEERIRLRMVLHAGEVTYDDHGVTATSINLAFRLLDAQPFKDALATSPGVLGLIASAWFFDEVIRHSRVSDPDSYRRVEVVVKETNVVGWIRLPDQPARSTTYGEPAHLRRPPVGGLAAVAEELAAVVRKQWQDEATRRELNDPYPLPVRWVPAPPDVVADWADLVRLATQGVGWPGARTGRTWARTVAELAGCAGDLAVVWEKVPTGRLVVLGEPGAGKTMLLVRLVLDLLAPGRREPGGPVPVLVSAASWDPTHQDFHTWLAGRLTMDYPGLGRKVPATSGTLPLARVLLDR